MQDGDQKMLVDLISRRLLYSTQVKRSVLSLQIFKAPDLKYFPLFMFLIFFSFGFVY